LTRAYVLVEGQTEETFIKRILGPHLAAADVFLTPILAATKRVKEGRKFKGGVTRYEPVRRDLRIGLPSLRRSCPHFNEWVTWLERLGEPTSPLSTV